MKCEAVRSASCCRNFSGKFSAVFNLNSIFRCQSLWFPHPDILKCYCLIFGTAREPPKVCIHPWPGLMNFYNLIHFQTTTVCRFLVNGCSILTLDNINCGTNEANRNHPCRSIIFGFARFKIAAWLGAFGIIARVSRCTRSLPSSAK